MKISTVFFRLSMTACLTLATLLFARLANSQSLALTFDDGPNMADEIGLSPADRNAAILSSPVIEAFAGRSPIRSKCNATR